MVDFGNIEQWTACLNPEDEHGKRRKALLQAAFDVIVEAGFEGLRTRAVADRAKVNIATLHYYFSSKQDLIEALAQFIGAKFITLHGPASQPSGFEALDRLRQEFSDARFYARHHPEMLLILEEFTLRGKRDSEVQKIVNQLDAGWRYGIEQMVARGAEDKTFRADIPQKEMVPILMSLFSGIPALTDDQIDAVERNTESWILSEETKKQLMKKRGGKR